MTYLLKITLLLFNILPETRLFSLRAFILGMFGFKIAGTARLVASVDIIGYPKLTIGKNSYIGHFVKIYGSGEVYIGENIDVGPEVSFITGSHVVDAEGERVAGKGYCADIKIGDGTWICSGAKVLGGSVIGSNCLIAPLAVVKGEFPDNAFIAGNPARVIKSLK